VSIQDRARARSGNQPVEHKAYRPFWSTIVSILGVLACAFDELEFDLIPPHIELDPLNDSNGPPSEPPEGPIPNCPIGEAKTENQIGVRIGGEWAAPLHLPETGSSQNRGVQIQPRATARSAPGEQRRNTNQRALPGIILPVQEIETSERQ
jgi:hypothetical protein